MLFTFRYFTFSRRFGAREFIWFPSSRVHDGKFVYIDLYNLLSSYLSKCFMDCGYDRYYFQITTCTSAMEDYCVPIGQRRNYTDRTLESLHSLMKRKEIR